MKVIDKNNFDFLRFLFASFVIVSHSFDLLKQNDTEWLRVITGNQISFSTIGVMGFFCISGFLVFRSYENSKNVKHFLFKRFLRIFPGLFILLLLSILFCGIFITNLPLTEYFTSTKTWTYLVKNIVLLFMLQLDLPGSFTNNPYPNVINGSLWTLPYEVIFYIFLSSLYFFKFLNRLWFLVLVWVSVYIMYLYFNNSKILFPYTSFTVNLKIDIAL